MNTDNKSKPLFTIHSRAPIRICDNGGWTDTWFAKYGAVFHIAVAPHARVGIAAYPRKVSNKQVTLHVSNYGDEYTFNPGDQPWLKHPLLEAAIAQMGVLEEYACRITIGSDAPAGMSTGTSAAVTVALIGALDILNESGLSRPEIAYGAHAVETEMLGQQSGIQDQLASAYGGINYIEMHAYPEASVTQIQLDDEQLADLEQRLILVFLGKAHSSSNVHEKVIADLEDIGPQDQRLDALRRAAERSQKAVGKGDWLALGEAMLFNTAAQEQLHSELVSEDARTAIRMARRYGALGWKVNGAGGDGGSLTILCGEDVEQQRQMVEEIKTTNPLFQTIPIKLDQKGLVCSREG
ncbi:MAG: GHMP kinase [Chloroflexi bacterium]|nr:MAG: GHMP kinase [Chloroflexota bacterium]MBL1196408.1 GHMP kinase [Chloroflexota bacterium]NOH13703.1 GHMP kinase [Chloroflexota bacterium]